MSVANARESLRVDGVPIYGNVHAVTRAGIRQAIRETIHQYPSKNPRALEIINQKEMRAYRSNRDLGWISLRLLMTHELDGREHLAWHVDDCCGILDPPEALRIIRAADKAYIFPVKNSLEPSRDNKDMRLLNQHARNELVHLLGHKSDWEPGQYALVEFEPRPDVGFVFRHGKSKVVLFFDGPTAEGTANGRNSNDLLAA